MCLDILSKLDLAMMMIVNGHSSYEGASAQRGSYPEAVGEGIQPKCGSVAMSMTKENGIRSKGSMFQLPYILSLITNAYLLILPT